MWRHQNRSSELNASDYIQSGSAKKGTESRNRKDNTKKIDLSVVIKDLEQIKFLQRYLNLVGIHG